MNQDNLIPTLNTIVHFQQIQQQFYDYLFMRYFQFNCLDQPNHQNDLNIQQTLSSQLIKQLQQIEQDSSVLDFCIQKTPKLKGSSRQGHQFQFMQRKLKGKRIVLAQMLVKNYPSLFIPTNQNQQIPFEKIFISILKKYSFLSILNHLALCDPQTSISQIMLQIGFQINFFMLITAVSSGIKLKQTSSQTFSAEILSAISYQLVQNQEFQQSLKSQALHILSGHLVKTFRKETNVQTYPQMIIFQFNHEYENFKQKYETSQTPINKRILQMHYLNELHFIARKDGGLNKMNLSQNSQKDMNQPLDTISLFIQIKNFNKSQRIINEKLLIKFLTEPYQTALFVLFKFLSYAGIRNVNKLFTKTRIEQNQIILVNPSAFLLINKKLVNRQNAESLSLSLWIILSVWIKHVRSQFQTEGTSQQQSEYISNSKDPRKIYTIKKDAYSVASQPQNISNKQVNENCISYIKQLNCTLMMFLLTLDVETTMLKYYPIENDVLKEMIDSDVLPSLLVESKFALNRDHDSEEQTNKERQTQIRNENMTEEQILQRIQQAQTVEEIQLLQKMMNHKKQNHQNTSKLEQTPTTDQLFTPQPLFWLLPWICVIQTRTVLPQLMRKPYGLTLTLKLMSQRPNTFYKVYDNVIVTEMIKYMREALVDIIEASEKQSNFKKGYCLRGNRNVGLRKSINYEYQKQKAQKNMEKDKKEVREKYPLMRKIFDMHKGTQLDQHNSELCGLMLNVAAKV